MSRTHVIVLSLLMLFSAGATAQTGAVINPNTSPVEQMAKLPGMNTSLATSIADGRPYTSMKNFDAYMAEHLDDQARNALYEHLFIPIDLNTARASEIRLIPGMTRKMVHEFEEYRPYTSMTQFRREIGKYVDQDEVERLARYVTVGSD